MFTSDPLFGEDITILPTSRRERAAKPATRTDLSDSLWIVRRTRRAVAIVFAVLAAIVLLSGTPALAIEASSNRCDAALMYCAKKVERKDRTLSRSISQCHAIRSCRPVCDQNATDDRKRDCRWRCEQTFRTRACKRATSTIHKISAWKVRACAIAKACISSDL